jgi:hypothetical protein
MCGSSLPYADRLKKLGWSTLEVRRKCLSFVTLYKIIFGYSDIDSNKHLDLIGPARTRSNHNYKLRPKSFHTNYFKFSFFNRHVEDWNSLPSDVGKFNSLAIFKKTLKLYLEI